MNDPLRPGIATRVRAALHHERSAAGLEALRVAGMAVHVEFDRAEQDRAGLPVDGLHLWTAPPSVGGRLAATWNAYVLQTLGAALVDADYTADEHTVGYVP